MKLRKTSARTQPAAPEDVLTFAFDGKGGAETLPAEAFAARRPDSGFAWQHLRRDWERTPSLLSALNLDHIVADALTAEETRPRCTVHGSGVLLNLRGVNLHPGAEPEDMISVRLWLEERRVVGVSVRRLQALDDMAAAIERGQAPTSPGDLVAKLALRLADRAEPAVAELNERIDALEDASDGTGMRSALHGIRRTAIILRRYLLPQKDALTTLEIEDIPWLAERDRARLREAADRMSRLGEDLDALRDRAEVVQDRIMEERADRMNRQMLVLSVVAAVFLPLGLVTGLLGINVGGIPGADHPAAFWIVCGLLVALGAGFAVWLRWLGMFR